jgi:hypothetical protein
VIAKIVTWTGLALGALIAIALYWLIWTDLSLDLVDTSRVPPGAGSASTCCFPLP